VTVVLVVLLAAGVWLLMPAGSRRRLPLPTRSRHLPINDLAGVSVGLGVALLVGGLVGVAVGLAVGVAARVVVGRLSTEDDAERVEALFRQAPDAVDCLASCLAAGAPLWTALRVVAQAFGDPVAGVFTRAVERHELGSPAPETFAEFLTDPHLGAVGRVLVRSSESGGALAESLVACSQRLRSDRASYLELKARAVGVKAVGPLTVCFLPAFLLLAVVPIVGSMVMVLL
jgi:Flp pilus assembly protein TadB